MNLLQLLKIIWEKSKLNLKSEASVNYLGYAWWVVEPVFHMFCYYFVFDLLLGRGGPGYVFFLLVGLVPWLWFLKSVIQGANSLVHGRILMDQILLPKLFFPLVVLVQTSIKNSLAFLLLTVFLLFTSHTFSVHWLAVLIIMLVQFAFTIPVVCLSAVAVVFVRDVYIIIPMGLQFLFFCSGIFFSFDDVGPQYKHLMFINPVAGIIQQYRDVLLNHMWPDWLYLAQILLLTFVLWLMVIYIYHNYENSITRVAQE